MKSALVFVLIVSFYAAYAQKGLPTVPLQDFPCLPYEYRRDDPVPTNVNQLRPHDIKAVMAIGDSMTAAFGAGAGHLLSGKPYIPREYRYLSYAGGGGSMRYTLPNFLSVFNRDIVGGATGYTLPIDDLSFGPKGHHIEPRLKKIINLNCALSGAVMQTIPQMVDMLVDQFETLYNGTIDIQNDWKVATILLGANNLCEACHNKSSNTPDAYEDALNSGLQYLYENIPHTRVFLLPMFNISQVYYWHETEEYCIRIWDTISQGECSCITEKSSTEQDRQIVDDTAVQYRQRVEKVANEWTAKNLTDFAVSFQPFTGNVVIVNDTLTSDFDCFHPSTLTHSYLASMLWNSILTPPGQKPVNATLSMLEGFDFVCPDKDSLLY